MKIGPKDNRRVTNVLSCKMVIKVNKLINFISY